jgi:hypothetical protein
MYDGPASAADVLPRRGGPGDDAAAQAFRGPQGLW